MSFQFIDNASIDHTTRILILSHAAKGKNIGKGRPRRKSRPAAEILLPTASDSSRAVIGSDAASNEPPIHSVLPFERPPCGTLSLYPMAFELNSESKVLFVQAVSFLSIELCPAILGTAIRRDMTRSVMLRFVFLDEAFFHCTIALLNSTKHTVSGGDQDLPKALRHMTRTFRLVNDKLSGSEATADTTFAAVLAMIQYECLQGHYEIGLVHFHGLQRMTNLRGGIHHLAISRPALALKVFRADLNFALGAGTPTSFQHTDIQSDCVVDLLNTCPQKDYQILDPLDFAKLPSESQDVALAILQLTVVINKSVTSPRKINGDLFHHTVILMGFRLIHINPLSASPLTDETGDILHLGLCSFLTTFLTGLNRKRPSLPHLAERIQSAILQSRQSSAIWHELSLWVLFVGRTTVLDQNHDTWVLPRMCEGIRYLGISTAWQLRHSLSKFPWINILHDSVCDGLYMKLSNEIRTAPLLGI